MLVVISLLASALALQQIRLALGMHLTLWPMLAAALANVTWLLLG